MFASEQTAPAPRSIIPHGVASTFARYPNREKDMTRLDFIARRMGGWGAARGSFVGVLSARSPHADPRAARLATADSGALESAENEGLAVTTPSPPACGAGIRPARQAGAGAHDAG